MKLKVEWHEDPRMYQGGCWMLVDGAGHLFAEPAQKGLHKLTEIRLHKIALMWNSAGEQEAAERDWEKRT